MIVKEIDSIEELITICKKYIKDKKEIDTIKKAYDYASEVHKNDVRKSGEPYMHHPLNVAYILTDLYADSDTISAALLHDTVEDTDITLDEIRELFNDDVCLLVDGVTKISRMNFSSEKDLVNAK